MLCHLILKNFTLNPAHPQMVQIVIEQTAVMTTTVTINSKGFSGFLGFSVFDSDEFILSIFFWQKVCKYHYYYLELNCPLISAVLLSIHTSLGFGSPLFTKTVLSHLLHSDFLKLHTKNHRSTLVSIVKRGISCPTYILCL